MPVILLINIIARTLQSSSGKTRLPGSIYNFLSNRNTTLILNGGGLSLISSTTLITGELHTALSTAFLIMGLNQISDACAQTIEDRHSHGTTHHTIRRTHYAQINQYSMPLLHGTGYCLIAYATGAALLAIPAYIAAVAGAVFGIAGRKDFAFFGFGLTALIASLLLFVPPGLKTTLLVGYPLYAAGNFIRFAEHKKTRLG